MSTATKVPAYVYRPGDGITYTWDRGPWIVAETRRRDRPGVTLVGHIAAPDTFTATAMMATVDRWRATRG